MYKGTKSKTLCVAAKYLNSDFKAYFVSTSIFFKKHFK
jgi:hypothetical protein